MTRLNRDLLYTGAEVAELWRVDAKTVSRWADQEKIPCVKTPGGHKRYPKAEVLKGLVAAGLYTPEEAAALSTEA